MDEERTPPFYAGYGPNDRARATTRGDWTPKINPPESRSRRRSAGNAALLLLLAAEAIFVIPAMMHHSPGLNGFFQAFKNLGLLARQALL
jgi:hypothetical protein